MTDVALTTSDGLELAGLALSPASRARAAVAMVHGLGEHAHRYDALHRALLAGGFAVGAADLRGHGRSPGARGHVERWDDYRADAQAIVELASSLAPARPVFLFGHSLGGLIALDFALHRPRGLAGVVASAPALRSAAPRRPALEALARVVSVLRPRTSIDFGLDPAGLSSDPAEVAAYRADPHVHGRVTMRWGVETLRTMAATRARAAEFPLPLLLLHGADDPISAPEGSREFDAACGHPDHALRLFEGNLHEVHHDRDRAGFERTLLRWLRERAMRAEVPAPGGSWRGAPSPATGA
jgi:alpha-beta hydrolase superfamily lysophospholipase